MIDVQKWCFGDEEKAPASGVVRTVLKTFFAQSESYLYICTLDATVGALRRINY